RARTPVTTRATGRGAGRSPRPSRTPACSCEGARVAMSTAANEVSPREDIIRALRDVHDPELHRSIVDLGMVVGVELRHGRARVSIKLTVAGCPLKAEIQRRVVAVLAPLPGVEAGRVARDHGMTGGERRELRQGS